MATDAQDNFIPGFSPNIRLKPISVNYLDPLAKANGNVKKHEVIRIKLSNFELDRHRIRI